MKMIKKECLLVCLSVKWMFGFGSAMYYLHIIEIISGMLRIIPVVLNPVTPNPIDGWTS